MFLSFGKVVPSLAYRVLERYARSTQNLPPRTFTVGEVQVLVDDPSTTDDDMETYARLMSRVRGLLKAKGFGRAWYGKIHIDCKGCGGVNPNDHGMTGGWYAPSSDAIWIFLRPTPSLIELLVHEIGHRVWYKVLKSGQRKRFTSLVKTHTVERPAPLEPAEPIKFFTNTALASAKRNIANELQSAKAMLSNQESGLEDQLFQLTSAAFDISWDGLYQNLGEEVEHASKMMVLERERAETMIAALPLDADKLAEKLDVIARYGDHYVDLAIRAHNNRAKFRRTQRQRLEDANKKWQDSYEQNPNPVLPVSSYGRSKVEEAFAEVFQQYVIGTADMSQDQIESFRSVLASEGVSMNDANENHRGHQRVQLGQIPAWSIGP